MKWDKLLNNGRWPSLQAYPRLTDLQSARSSCQDGVSSGSLLSPHFWAMLSCTSCSSCSFPTCCWWTFCPRLPLVRPSLSMCCTSGYSPSCVRSSERWVQTDPSYAKWTPPDLPLLSLSLPFSLFIHGLSPTRIVLCGTVVVVVVQNGSKLHLWCPTFQKRRQAIFQI